MYKYGLDFAFVIFLNYHVVQMSDQFAKLCRFAAGNLRNIRVRRPASFSGYWFGFLIYLHMLQAVLSTGSEVLSLCERIFFTIAFWRPILRGDFHEPQPPLSSAACEDGGLAL